MLVAKGLYNFETGEIYLSADATLFTRFHELAHREQHERKPWAYWIWFMARLPGTRYAARVLLEWDANRRALAVMRKLGLSTAAAEKEARQSLLTYVTRQDTNVVRSLSSAS